MRSTWLALALLVIAGCGSEDAASVDDSVRWRRVFDQLPGALISVSGTSEKDVWTVGGDPGTGATVLHFDGKAWVREKIERQRDMTLGAGLTWNGNKYHIDQTMIAALNGRLTLWQEGKIAPDAKLPIRRMDNVIELLDRKQHADLADALRLHGEQVYAASWVEKDKMK